MAEGGRRTSKVHPLRHAASQDDAEANKEGIEMKNIPCEERRDEPKESESSTSRAPIESKGAPAEESSQPNQEPVDEAVDGGSQPGQEPVNAPVDGGSQPGQETPTAAAAVQQQSESAAVKPAVNQEINAPTIDVDVQLKGCCWRPSLEGKRSCNDVNDNETRITIMNNE